MDNKRALSGDPSREKVFNAPLLPVLIALSIPVLYYFQTQQFDDGLRWAFRPITLIEGGWWPTIVSSMMVHGGWAHAGINAAFALAFGPPIARLLPGGRGAIVFFGYYIVCGLIGTLGYGLVNLHSAAPMLGASGAISGLLGGAVRLLGSAGYPRPLTDRRVLVMSAVILALNVATGLFGFAPGSDGAGVAWEAHAFGYVAGLLLIGPMVTFFGRRGAGFASRRTLGDPRSR